MCRAVTRCQCLSSSPRPLHRTTLSIEKDSLGRIRVKVEYRPIVSPFNSLELRFTRILPWTLTTEPTGMRRGSGRALVLGSRAEERTSRGRSRSSFFLLSGLSSPSLMRNAHSIVPVPSSTVQQGLAWYRESQVIWLTYVDNTFFVRCSPNYDGNQGN